ncbi:hypothetical protein ACXR0O_14390 [Verrucomicrobiota bacterium sgz303538]
MAFSLLATSAFAGSVIVEDKGSQTFKEPCPPNTLDWISIRSSYTWSSDFERGHDASGDSFYKGAELNHRIPLNLFNWPNVECGQWYLRLGAEYRRWDFDNEGGLPIPNTLQSFAAIVALEYVIRDATAVTIEARPGFYFEHDVRGDAFTVPVLVYFPLWWHEGEKLSWALIGGVSYNGLRSYPFLPAVGLAAKYGKWTLLAVPPAPRLSYAASDKLNLWIEGEVTGGAFRTDSHNFPGKEELNHAVVTYSEWRVGAGFTWKPCANATIDIGGGYTFHREFDFHRADENFKTDEGAPFVKVELRASF